MPKFPEPPPVRRLAQIATRVRALPAGTELWRIYFRSEPHSTTWDAFRAYGPLRTARFDHHPPPSRVQDRAILYAAAAAQTCLAEVFQEQRFIDIFDREPWLVGFAIIGDLTLLDLTGPWPTAAGASMAISSGPRPRAQRWSRAIYEAYPEVQGLWYSSSMHANQPAVALYERAAEVLPPSPFFHRALGDPTLLTALRNAAYVLGYELGGRGSF